MKKEIKTKPMIITMLGDTCVGKTELCLIIGGFKFNPCVLATIGIEKINSEMTMSDGNKIKFKLWDTAGVQRFRSIILSQLHYSKGIIVVFDVTCRKSFEHLNYWLEEIRKYSQDMPVVLFGNKCDLEERREVTYVEAKRYADEHEILYFETSAKYNKGIKEGFEALFEIIFNEKKKNKNKNNCGIY